MGRWASAARGRLAGHVEVATLGLEPRQRIPRRGQRRVESQRFAEACLGLVVPPLLQERLTPSVMPLNEAWVERSPPTDSAGPIRHNSRGRLPSCRDRRGTSDHSAGVHAQSRSIGPPRRIVRSAGARGPSSGGTMPDADRSQRLLVASHGLVKPAPNAEHIAQVVESIGKAGGECQCAAAGRLGLVQQVGIRPARPGPAPGLSALVGSSGSIRRDACKHLGRIRPSAAGPGGCCPDCYRPPRTRLEPDRRAIRGLRVGVPPLIEGQSAQRVPGAPAGQDPARWPSGGGPGPRRTASGCDRLRPAWHGSGADSGCVATPRTNKAAASSNRPS